MLLKIETSAVRALAEGRRAGNWRSSFVIKARQPLAWTLKIKNLHLLFCLYTVVNFVGLFPEQV
jgi:hypothetical protein